MSSAVQPAGKHPAAIPLTARALLTVAKMLGLLVEALLALPAPRTVPVRPEEQTTTAGSCTRWLRDPVTETEYVERWLDGELIDVEVHAT